MSDINFAGEPIEFQVSAHLRKNGVQDGFYSKIERIVVGPAKMRASRWNFGEDSHKMSAAIVFENDRMKNPVHIHLQMAEIKAFAQQLEAITDCLRRIESEYGQS